MDKKNFYSTEESIILDVRRLRIPWDIRAITSRGAKHCRLLENVNLLLTLLALIIARAHTLYCIMYIRLFKEEKWKYFCGFAFVFYNTNFLNKHKFNDIKKLKHK